MGDGVCHELKRSALKEATRESKSLWEVVDVLGKIPLVWLLSELLRAPHDAMRQRQ
jgi:hypothetical protein